jgi:hypothetical protein
VGRPRCSSRGHSPGGALRTTRTPRLERGLALGFVAGLELSTQARCNAVAGGDLGRCLVVDEQGCDDQTGLRRGLRLPSIERRAAVADDVRHVSPSRETSVGEAGGSLSVRSRSRRTFSAQSGAFDRDRVLFGALVAEAAVDGHRGRPRECEARGARRFPAPACLAKPRH